MDNYTNNNTTRRYTAHISVLGTTQIHLRNPLIIAWWSAAPESWSKRFFGNTLLFE